MKQNLNRPNSPTLKTPLLIIGDAIIFYVALFATLLIRYGQFDAEQINSHLFPFSIGFLFWLLLAYIGGLYEPKLLKNTAAFIKTFVSLLFIQAALMIALFYFLPALGIAPKINLFLFLAAFTVLAFAWRALFNTTLASGSKNRLLLIGNNKTISELAEYIKNNQQLGYEVGAWLSDGIADQTSETLIKLVRDNLIQTIVVPNEIHNNPNFSRLVYQCAVIGINIVNLSELYEIIFRKVSLMELEGTSFLEQLSRQRFTYQIIRNLIEVSGAILLLILTLPITLAAAILIKLTSHGPIIYSQKRVGAQQRVFSLYKFRSMYATKDKNPDADASSPVWSTPDDNRITQLGRVLRFTHIDELPQLMNIIAGQMSFVGPRPERPELDEGLKKRIPYYELRYFIKPGITGWAQINYRYVASVDDAYERVQYDIYYILHRSALLDLGILIKTIKKIFVQEK